MSTKTTTKKKPAGTGGSKGRAVLRHLAEFGPMTRRDCAESVGCTVQRVGEAIRAAGDLVEEREGRTYVFVGDPELIGAEPKKSEPEPEPDEELEPADEPATRTGRCEHEKRAKKKTGSCTKCPPLAD